MRTPDIDSAYSVMLARRRRARLHNLAVLGAILVITYWAAVGSDFSAWKFAQGFPFMVDFLSRTMPPNPHVLPRLSYRIFETIAIALLGTTFGALFAFPLSFIASRNITRSRLVYQVSRGLIDVSRGVSEIVWAFLMVSAVGLGPFPGVLALTIHNTGALGKYFSETIEHMDPGVLEAVAATGANRIKVCARGVFPELKPLLTNYIFFYFEASVRQATILGLVGAGGIGYEFIVHMKHLDYQSAMTVVLAMLTLVIITDRSSSFVRRRLVAL